jgi:hypothetical protein
MCLKMLNGLFMHFMLIYIDDYNLLNVAQV